MSAKRLRDLAREYRSERAAILEDPGRSWEKKMFAIRELHKRYTERKDEVEERESA